MHIESQLVVGQVKREFVAKGNNMMEYLAQVLELTHLFNHFSIEQIPREENSLDNNLAQMASDPDCVESYVDVFLEVLDKHSI